jgi:hypothetical protein
MKSGKSALILSTSLALAFVATPSPAGAPEGPLVIGISHSEGKFFSFAQPIAMAASPNGVTVAGGLLGTVDFDSGKRDLSLTSGHGFNTFVANYSPAGKIRWARAFVGLSVDVSDLAVDTSAASVAVGRFFGSADFDPGPQEAILTTPGASSSGFIVKLDHRGRFEWARQHSEVGAWARAVAIDSRDSIWVASRPRHPNSLIKLSSEGELELQFDTSFEVFDMEAGPDDSVYLTGRFSGLHDFDPGPAVHFATSTWQSDVFVLKLSKSGEFRWVATAGGPEGDLGWTLAVGSEGRVLTAGYCRSYGEVDFDPDPARSHMVRCPSRFLWKLSADGELEWSHALRGRVVTADVDLRPDGSVLVGGWFDGLVDFDPGPDEHLLVPVGLRREDGFLLYLDAQGSFEWVGRVGGHGSQFSTVVATAGKRDWVGGRFDSPADLDPTDNLLMADARGRENLYLVSLIRD